jgi:PAS domain S-box-containing protein
MRLEMPDRAALSVQLVVAFGGLALLLAVAIGLAATVLLQRQLLAQAAARTAQGVASTTALVDARIGEVAGLVALASQRPTLSRLMRDGGGPELPSYLATLRRGAALDGLAVVDSDGRVLATSLADGVGRPPGHGAAAIAAAVTADGQAVAVLHATAPVGDARKPVGSVTGWALVDDRALEALAQQTGLEHAVYVDGARSATSSSVLPSRLGDVRSGLQVMGDRSRFVSQVTLSDSDPTVVDVLALPTEDVVASIRRATIGLAAAALAVGVVTAALAVALARRMTFPLEKLADAGRTMGRGDLSQPVAVPRGVREIDELAATLEAMRSRLASTQEALRSAKQWSEGLIEALSEGVVTLDRDGRVTSYSSGAERIFGWSAREAIGRAWSDLLSPTGELEASLHPPPVPLPMGTTTRVAAARADGDAVTLSVTAGAPTQKGGDHVLVVRDVTEEEQALRQRETLLGSLTHELVTPLASLFAAAELVQDIARTAGDEALSELAESIVVGTLRLREMVDNLLSSAGLHTGHFAVVARPTDLAEVLEEARLAIGPLLASKGQYLRVDCPAPSPCVMADRRRLDQVLVNLVSNASRYGPPDRPIELRARRHGGWVWVEVADHGPGVPASLRPHLFRPFSRSVGAEGSGMGLGLSIVRSIVELHGGSVAVDATADGGALFRFSLRACEE